MLVNRAQLQPGEEVLVLAAGSGVGSAALQIAKFFGARVIATAGNDEKLAKARGLGAAEVIHHGIMPIAQEGRGPTTNPTRGRSGGRGWRGPCGTTEKTE